MTYVVSSSVSSLRGCSYEHSFLVVFPPNREKDISMHSYTKYFHAWGRFILAGYYAGQFRREPVFKIDDTNLKKNGSIRFYLNILRPVNFISCLVRDLHRFKDNKLPLCHLYYYYTRQKNDYLRFLVNGLIVEWLLALRGSRKGPIK